MSQYVIWKYYLNLSDAVENATTHGNSFDEIQELVHLVEFLEG